MDANKYVGQTPPPQNFEDVDPSYDLVIEPQFDTIILYLPGFKKEELRVQLTGAGILKISGQRPTGGGKWERFLKQFPVSFNCDTNRIAAKFESGILYITLLKLITPAEKPESESSRQKPAESSDEETEEEEPSKRGENAASGTEPGEPNKSEKENGSPTNRGVRTEPDYVSDNEPVKDGKEAENFLGAKSGAGNAKMNGYGDTAAAAAQLNRTRKIMNVGLVILLVVGVGLYLNNKIRSWSSNEDGDL